MIKGVRDLQGKTDSIFGKKNNVKKPQKFNTPCKTRWDVVGYPLRKNKGVFILLVSRQAHVLWPFHLFSLGFN